MTSGVTWVGVRAPKRLLLLLVALMICGLLLTPARATGEGSRTPLVVGSNSTDSDGDGVLDRPDGAAAAAAAKLKGKPVEDLSLRAPNSQSFANPNGTVTQKSYSAPVKVRRGDSWADVDYNLAAKSDGSYAPEAAPTDVSVGGGGFDPAATVRFADGAWASVSWPGKLPAPHVVGGTATYEISDAVDLLVVVTGRGLSTRIRLNEAPTADDLKYTLKLKTNKISVEQPADGDVSFERTTDGKSVAADAQLVAWDARRDKAGDPVELVPVDGKLGESTLTGGTSELDLVLGVPKRILTDPATKYPVVIDPDIDAVSGTEDAWIRNGSTIAYGNDYRLLVGPIISHQNTNPTHSLMRWSNNQLTGRTIVAADLHLFQYSANTCVPRRMNIHPLDSKSWNESTVTWANHPNGMTSTGTSTFLTQNVGGNGCAPNGYIQTSVKEIVQAWAKGPTNGGFVNNGLTMNVPIDNNNDYSYERRFCSSEPDTGTSCATVARIPYMTVTYNGNPDTPTSPRVENPNPGQQPLPCGTLLGNMTELPIAQAEVSDPDGDNVTPYFQWGDGSTVAPTDPEFAGAIVTSGATAAVALPIGSGEGVFSFRVRAKDSLQAWSPYSSDCSFTIDRSLPGNPTLGGLPPSWASGSSYDVVFTPGGDDPAKTVGYSYTWNDAIPPPSPQYAANGPGHTRTQTITPNPAHGAFQKLRLWAYSTTGAISAIPGVAEIEIF